MIRAERDSIRRYEELREQTVPGILLQRAIDTPAQVAYRVKKRGIYQERTWADLRDRVARCAVAMKELGLAKGKTVALMGDPCEEYVICELAAQSLGAITYGIYPTSSSVEVRYLMNHGEAFIFIAENQEYVDRILPIIDQLGGLRHIVVADTKGIFSYNHTSLVSFENLMERGDEHLRAEPRAFERLVKDAEPSDPLSIIYTSGTTGDPKGAVISHGKHLAATYTLVDRYPILSARHHRTVVYLPLCHIIGKEIAITLPLLTNIVPHYGEHIEDLETTIFETAPTVLFTVPRYLQKFASRMLVGLQQSSPLKRLLYHLAVRVGRGHLRRVWKQKTFPDPAYMFFYAVIFRPILNKIGFDKLDLLICVGAPLSADLAALWQVYGVSVSDLYGQTETGGAAIASQEGHYPKPGDVGKSPAGWEARLGDNGEIQVKGEDMFEGYWKQPDLTAQVLTSDGWLHTGDTGEWTPEGNLKIKDRIRDIMVTSGGKTLSPTYIENMLRSSQYISEAVVFGHNRNHVTALIEIDFDTVSAWARKNGITYTGFSDLCKNPVVIELITTEVGRANVDLARVEQVKDFRIMPNELDPWHDGEPITPTRKVKRDLMYGKFRELIESMYSQAREEELVASEIGDLVTQQVRD